MSIFKKLLSLILVVTMFYFYMPATSFSQEDIKYPPESWISPEQEVSEEAPKEKKSNLLWVLLGLLAVVGGVAAAAGGGGGSGGSSGGDDEPKTGDVDFDW